MLAAEASQWATLSTQLAAASRLDDVLEAVNKFCESLSLDRARVLEELVGRGDIQPSEHQAISERLEQRATRQFAPVGGSAQTLPSVRARARHPHMRL